MLQRLRDKAQGWAAWVIIGIIALSFILLGTDALFLSGNDQQTVAKVDGTKITSTELERAYQRYLAQAKTASLDPDEIKKELLDALVEETILLRAALKMGMRVNEQRVMNTVYSIPQFQEEGRFSNTLFHRFLANASYTPEGFQTLLRDSLLRQQLQQGIILTSFALKNEVESLVKFILQKRDIRYLTISSNDFEKEIQFNEEEISQYYQSHLKKFTKDELISLEYVHLSLENLAQYQPTEEEIKNHYQQNKDQFTDPEKVHVAHILIRLPKNADEETLKQAQNKIKEIQTKLKSGESFEALAKSYSDDKSSADNGGELQWFEKSEMIPEFEKSAFSLEKPGEVSDPVRTQFGFHLIKLIEKQKEKNQPLDEVKSQVIAKLKEQHAQEQFANQLDDLTSLSFDHPDSLQPIHDKLRLTIQKTDLFSRQLPPKDKLLQQPNVLSAAFSQSVKEDKNNSDVIKIDNENYVVIRVEKHIPSQQKPLDEVKPEIERLLIAEKAQGLAKAKAEEIYSTILKHKEDENNLLMKYPWQEKNDLMRQSTEDKGDLVTGAFSIPTLPNENPFKVARLQNGDYILIWLTKVEDGNFQKLTEMEKTQYQRALEKHHGELEYELFVTEETKSAKVKKYTNKM